MKFIFQLLVIIILGFLFDYFIVWWGIAIAAFIGGALFSNNGSFWAGFLGIGLLWLIGALWLSATAATNFVGEIASVLHAGKLMLLLFTSVLGGLLGGFAALSGSLLRGRKKEFNQYKL